MTSESHQRDMHAVERDWRVRVIWTAAKLIFGALVVAGVQDANQRLSLIDASIMAQKLDHQQLEQVKLQSDQAIQTLKVYGQAIQANTSAIRVNADAVREMNTRNAHRRYAK